MEAITDAHQAWFSSTVREDNVPLRAKAFNGWH